jgi:hypothetical protein
MRLAVLIACQRPSTAGAGGFSTETPARSVETNKSQAGKISRVNRIRGKLAKGAMLNGSIIDELGEIKGVALWMLVRFSLH